MGVAFACHSCVVLSRVRKCAHVHGHIFCDYLHIIWLFIRKIRVTLHFWPSLATTGSISIRIVMKRIGASEITLFYMLYAAPLSEAAAGFPNRSAPVTFLLALMKGEMVATVSKKFARASPALLQD